MDMSSVTSAIQSLAATHPWLVSFLAAVGVLRTVMKPLMAVINGYAIFAPAAQKDVIKKVQASDIYLWFVWILDFLASVKLAGTAQAALKASRNNPAGPTGPVDDAVFAGRRYEYHAATDTFQRRDNV